MTRRAIEPPRIALLGLFGGANIGNEASLDRMVAVLRRSLPEARLAAIAAIPEGVKERLGIEGVELAPTASRGLAFRVLNRLLLRIPARIAQLMTALAFMGKIDAVIVPGTGAFDDFGFRPLSYPLDMMIWCLAARLRGARLLLVSVGAGPIVHPLSCFLFTRAARMADYRSFRDQLSKDYMSGLGVPTANDPVVPDLVFGLDLKAARAPASATSDRRTVGLGVMSYFGWSGEQREGAAIYELYIEKIATFAAWLLDQGHDVRLIIGETTDRRAAKDVLAVLARRYGNDELSRVAYEPASSIEDLGREIARTGIVVATRYHNVVCALMLNRPTISLGYALKNDVLMSEAGLGGFCQSVDDFDLELLKAQFLRLVAEGEAIALRLEVTNREFRERLDRQDDVIQDLLLGTAPLTSLQHA